MGASLGTYVLSQSPHKNRIAGFFAVSPFSDYRQITRDFLSRNWLSWSFQWPLSLTINNDYSPADYVRKISPISIYLIHGSKDAIIDVAHSKKLFENALDPKAISIFESSHNDIFAQKAVQHYIKSIIKPP